MKIPEVGNIYSINEGYCSQWAEHTKAYVESKKNPQDGSKAYGQRYVGSMVKISIKKKNSNFHQKYFRLLMYTELLNMGEFSCTQPHQLPKTENFD